MIRVDLATGSVELLPLFSPYGVTAQRSKLQFGDIDFTGSGPHGTCCVVFERKRIDDLLQSMRSKRLSGHQLPGMAQTYDYGYLIVEGIWRPGLSGEVEVLERSGKWRGRAVHSRAVTNYLMGLALRAGMIVWRTGSDRETVSFVVDQYRMFQKPWEEHRCHEAVYAPVEEHERAGRMLSLAVRDVGLAEKMAMQIPGLDRKARWVAEYFKGSVVEMVGAGVEEWGKVKWKDVKGQWKRMGRKTAEGIVASLRNGSGG